MLALHLRVHGGCHPVCADALLSLARAHLALGALPDCRSSAERAYEIYKAIYTQTSPAPLPSFGLGLPSSSTFSVPTFSVPTATGGAAAGVYALNGFSSSSVLDSNSINTGIIGSGSGSSSVVSSLGVGAGTDVLMKRRILATGVGKGFGSEAVSGTGSGSGSGVGIEPGSLYEDVPHITAMHPSLGETLCLLALCSCEQGELTLPFVLNYPTRLKVPYSRVPYPTSFPSYLTLPHCSPPYLSITCTRVYDRSELLLFFYYSPS